MRNAFEFIHIRQNCTEAASGGILRKTALLKISRKLQEGTWPRVSFLIKLRISGLRFYQKVTLVRYLSLNFAKVLKAPISKNICEGLRLVAGWRTTQKLSQSIFTIYAILTYLPLLTCLVYVNLSVASSFPSFMYNFCIRICFYVDETKLTNGKLSADLRSVLKYNFKKRD